MKFGDFVQKFWLLLLWRVRSLSQKPNFLASFYPLFQSVLNVTGKHLTRSFSLFGITSNLGPSRAWLKNHHTQFITGNTRDQHLGKRISALITLPEGEHLPPTWGLPTVRLVKLKTPALSWQVQPSSIQMKWRCFSLKHWIKQPRLQGSSRYPSERTRLRTERVTSWANSLDKLDRWRHIRYSLAESGVAGDG